MDALLFFRVQGGISDRSLKWNNDDSFSHASLSHVDHYSGSENTSTTPSTPIGCQPICQLVLVKTVRSSSVRIWDLAMLIPNVLFFLFLLLIFRRAVLQLRRTNSPIFTSFFVLICVANVMSVLRCVTSLILECTSMKASAPADRIMWLFLRFFLLATELSVVTFCLLFGHLDSRTSIQRVLIVTFFISLLYSGTQGTLEFIYVNKPFHNISYSDNYYTLFGHGGMIFWFVSSVCLALLYGAVFLLPFLKIQQQRLTLPTKKSFFWYCFVLACLNIVQAVGSALLYFDIKPGMCLVNFMAYIYFAGFAPLVYAIFLHQFFSSGSTADSLQFSYKLQRDEDDDLSLPHHAVNYDPQDGSSIGVDFNDSTHFSANPLYAGLITRSELPFTRDHFAYAGMSPGKQKSGELQNVTA